jgi:hypothetical protein
MGGSDESSNLVELTIEEHALAHKKLWEEHGCWQDEIAYKALSGQIDKQEINYYISVINNLGEKNPMFGKPSYMRGKKHTEESKQKIKEARKKQKIIHSEETKKKIGQSHKNKIISDEHKKFIIESNKKRIGEKRGEYKNKGIQQSITVCPHCNTQGGYASMKRWHFDNCKNKL